MDGAHRRDRHVLTCFNTAFFWAEKCSHVKMPLAESHPAMPVLSSIPSQLKQLWCLLQCYSNAKNICSYQRDFRDTSKCVCVCAMILKYLPHCQWKEAQKKKSRMSATTGELVNFKEKTNCQKFSSLTLHRPLLPILCHQNMFNGSH